MPLLAAQMNQLLQGVSRPARYLGGEWNSVTKPWDEASVRMAFAFPDVYEVGMSHLGLQILYGLVNQCEGYLMERVFAPWPDMEASLRSQRVPLFSLESQHSLHEFDIVGFTLQYELSYTNIINMLDLGGIPLYSRQRGEGHPLVLAGGPGAFNPEPLAEFLDAVVLGEGEEVLLEILDVFAGHKARCDGRIDRKQLLQELAEIPGVYVPSAYTVEYLESGAIKSVCPSAGAAGLPVTKRLLKDFDQAYFPLKPIVPYLETVHDRIMLELFRGCQRGCRFCQAGMLYRPSRERKRETLVRQAQQLVENTGYDEISLTSLSTGDYSEVQKLARELSDCFHPLGIGLSLPSLRVDTFSVDLAREIQKGRKTGLTFAPEAGTQRLRDVINKGVTEEDLLSAARAAFEGGWSSIKLYFMIGLPTEEQEDLDGLVRLAYQVADLGSQAQRRGRFKKRLEVTVSVSNYVPKAHTPFQWEGQDAPETLRQKQEYLRQQLRDRRLKFNWHDVEASLWEAVLARGDRRLASLLVSAWSKGCRFDGWTEHFKPQIWREAADECGVGTGYYANQDYACDQVLPWDHLSPGIEREFLQREYEYARQGKVTGDCRFSTCTACGVCMALETELSGGWEGERTDVPISD